MNDKFVCDFCGCIDNLEFAYPEGHPGTPLKCTECLTGTWHGFFLRRPMDPEKDLVINRECGIGLS